MNTVTENTYNNSVIKLLVSAVKTASVLEYPWIAYTADNIQNAKKNKKECVFMILKYDFGLKLTTLKPKNKGTKNDAGRKGMIC